MDMVPMLPFVLIASILWLVPIVAAVWALMTLHQLRVGQAAMRARLDRLEQLLQER